MAGQVGFKTETTVGVPVTPDQFIEVTSSTMQTPDAYLRREGIRPRLTERPGRLGFHNPKGKVEGELQNVNFATLLKLFFGTVNTTGSGPYTHTASPGPQVGANKSATIQTGVTDTSDTVRPFTAAGCKVAQWSISAGVNEYAKFSFDWQGLKLITNYRTVADGVTTSGSAAITSVTAAFSEADQGRPISGVGIPVGTTILSVQSATAATLSANATASGTGVTFTFGIPLASASYSANLDPWTFIDCTVTVAGTPIASASSASIMCNKNMRLERPRLGTRFGNEALVEGRWEFTGEIAADFENMTVITQAASAAQVALVMTFSHGTDVLTITANVQIEGDVPSLSSQGLESQSIKWRAGHTGTDAQTVTAVLVNGDATAV